MESLAALKPRSNPFSRNHLIRDAIGQALYDAMMVDGTIHLFGEGATVKMHYDAPKIEADFGHRVHTLPICEDGNVNFTVGTSLLGIKPVVDIISADFLYRAMDSICNTAAKLNFLRPAERHTIVIRAEFLLGGPTTGQRPEALFTHVPGLRVVIPSTPRDAYGLMKSALATQGVTLFFEDRMIDDQGQLPGEDLRLGEVVAFGEGIWRMKGLRGNVTIVTYGVMRQVVEDILKSWNHNGDYYATENLGAALIDLRTIYPIDWQLIQFALTRTSRLLIVEPDVDYGGVGAEIAATIIERMPHVRVRRLGAPRITVSAARIVQAEVLPTKEQIIDAITSDW